MPQEAGRHHQALVSGAAQYFFSFFPKKTKKLTVSLPSESLHLASEIPPTPKVALVSIMTPKALFDILIFVILKTKTNTPNKSLFFSCPLKIVYQGVLSQSALAQGFNISK